MAKGRTLSFAFGDWFRRPTANPLEVRVGGRLTLASTGWLGGEHTRKKVIQQRSRATVVVWQNAMVEIVKRLSISSTNPALENKQFSIKSCRQQSRREIDPFVFVSFVFTANNTNLFRFASTTTHLWSMNH